MATATTQLEVLETAKNDICDDCAAGSPVIARTEDGVLFHEAVMTGSRCRAQSIRELITQTEAEADDEENTSAAQAGDIIMREEAGEIHYYVADVA